MKGKNNCKLKSNQNILPDESDKKFIRAQKQGENKQETIQSTASDNEVNNSIQEQLNNEADAHDSTQKLIVSSKLFNANLKSGSVKKLPK